MSYGDTSSKVNGIDKKFFKITGFLGISFFILILFFNYYVFFGSLVENTFNFKSIIYTFSMIILEAIILVKTHRMFTIVKKRTSDYITAFFLIFFQLFIIYFFSVLIALTVFLIK